MKDQYFGDVNDYLKYGLLRCFAECGFKIGVCWMLTEADEPSSGKNLGYLSRPSEWRDHDPELFDFLSRCVSNPSARKTRSLMESGLLPRSSFHDALLADGADERTAYFKDAAQSLAGSDLVFFDPDNGLERSLPSGRKGSSKYVYWKEVEATWRRGLSLVVFQYFAREPREAFTASLLQKLVEQTGATDVFALRTSHVVFLVATQTEHLAMASSAQQLVLERWGRRMTHVHLSPAFSMKPMPDKHSINIFWSEEDDCFVADLPDFKFCSAFGDTPEEALAELQIAKALWMEVAVESGRPVPSPSYRPSEGV